VLTVLKQCGGKQGCNLHVYIMSTTSDGSFMPCCCILCHIRTAVMSPQAPTVAPTPPAIHVTRRVGRTGRAGDKEGVAYTLLLGKKDSHFAGLLVNSLSLGGQDVPRDLHTLAMKVSTQRACKVVVGLWFLAACAAFAGLLVNSLSLGEQDVPRDLHALAMNVSTQQACKVVVGLRFLAACAAFAGL
jgi:hypothetical protein